MCSPQAKPKQQKHLTDQEHTAYIAAYQEVCTSVHAIDDSRMKLLGFVPLISGAGIALLLNSSLLARGSGLLAPLGLFGFVVTLGLLFYDLRGLRLCYALVEHGARVERHLGLADAGQFNYCPENQPEVRIGRGKTSAAKVIYPAVLAAWIFLVVLGVIHIFFLPREDVTKNLAIIIVGLACAFTVFVISSYLTSRTSQKYEETFRNDDSH